MNVRKFTQEPWGVDIHIVWPVTSKQFRTYVRRALKLPDFEDPGDFQAICHYSSGHTMVIGLKFWEGTPRDVGLLAHELFHATYHMLTERETPLRAVTNETYAYTIGSLMEHALTAMKRKK